MFKRTNARLMLVAFLTISALSGSAGANSVSYTITDASDLRTTDFKISLAFPKFDSTLGTLQDVVLSMSDKGNFSGSLKNNSATAQSFIVGENIHLSLGIAGMEPVLSDDLFVSQSYSALGSRVSGAFGAFNPTSSTGLVTLTSGAAFDSFRTATAPVVLDFTTLTKTVTRGGGGNLTSSIFTKAGATFTIQYDYEPATTPPVIPRINGVPEPASLAMTALGGMMAAGFGLVRRRSRTAVAERTLFPPIPTPPRHRPENRVMDRGGRLFRPPAEARSRMNRASSQAFFVLFAIALGGAWSIGAEPTRIRVLSYNIRHGEGLDGKLDLERQARVIRSLDPDVVSLQEVDRGVKRTNGIDEPAELGRLTGMKSLFERNIPYQGGDYGNAILTRLPDLGHKNIPLPSHYPGEQRGALTVDLMTPGGRTPIRLIATHLDYRPDDGERLESVATIGRIADEFPGRPTLVVGDLNALPESKTLAAFETRWKRANPTPLLTFPADKPTRQIDYVLYQPAGRWKVIETRVPDEPVASDHRPLLVVLELVD